jgi:exopolysaccharide biosynthesis protein
MHAKKRDFRILLTIIAGLFSLAFGALFVYMLPHLGVTVGTATGEKRVQRPALDYSEAYERHVNNLSATAMEGIIPIPKAYQLPEDTVVAPRPDPAGFGEATDPADTAELLERAAELLDGQETLWRTDTPIRKDSKVLWYLDDTILSITWKQVIDQTVYTFTEVKVAHPSQFRRYFADNTFASPVQYVPTELARTVNAVSAMSADFYKFRRYGIVVYQRQLYRDEGRWLDTCFVDGSGDLHLVHANTLKSAEEMERYIADNDILFSLAFGPILIEDGRNVIPDEYPVGEIKDYYARAAIGQLGECHYLLVTVNSEPNYGRMHATTKSVAEALLRLGVPNAYTLDGGQTAAMIVNGELINSVEFGSQRTVSDIIYFATAIPEKTTWEAEHG